MKKILLIVMMWLCIVFRTFAIDQPNTIDVGVRNDNGANAAAIVGRGGDMSITTNAKTPVMMPYGAGSVAPTVIPTQRSEGIAEKAQRYDELIRGLTTRGKTPVSAYLNKDRVKPVLSKDIGGWFSGDFSDVADLAFIPGPDYLKNVPAEKMLPVMYSEQINNFSDFGNLSPTQTFYYVGVVTAIVKSDVDIQELITPQALVNEALRFIPTIEINGFAELTPVVLSDTFAYFSDTSVDVKGWQFAPSASMARAANIGLGVGGMGSIERGGGVSRQLHRVGIPVYLFAPAPNPTQGHAIVLKIRDINARTEARLAELRETNRPKAEAQSTTIIQNYITVNDKQAVKPHSKKKSGGKKSDCK